jgi:TusA-related sulfurtransferase
MENRNMSIILGNQKLDIRDYVCPLSILKVLSMLNKMNDGQVLEVWSNDLETKVVLEQIIDKSNHEFLGIKNEEEDERIYVKRCTQKERQDKDIAK